MLLLGTIGHYLDKLRRRRRLAQAERMIAALPDEVQKDIGWPDAYEESRWRIARHLTRY